MKLTIEHIKTILLVVVIVILLWPKSHKEVVDRTGEIKAKDEVIQAIEKQRDILIEWKNEKVAELQNKDSLLALAFIKNQTAYKPIYDNLKNIPVHISRIAGNDDSIRAAFSK